MTKVVIIGDIHGRSIWRDIVLANPDADRYIFVGDYFDSFDISTEDQIKNFNQIIEFKESEPNKVILLLGNHDWHYCDNANETYSGYSQVIKNSNLIEKYYQKGYFQLFHKETKGRRYLISHAGLSKNYLNRVGLTTKQIIEGPKHGTNIVQFLLNYYILDNSGYGEHTEQGPIWIRPEALITSPVKYYRQIVGHTKQKGGVNNYKEKIYFVDTFDSNTSYMVLNDGIPEFKTL